MSRCTQMSPGGNRSINKHRLHFNRYINGSGIESVSYAISRYKNRRSSFRMPIIERIPIEPVCSSRTPINLSDIASPLPSQPGWWGLNADTTISRCQVLTMPDGNVLFTYGFNLTNNGLINLATSYGLIVTSNISGNSSLMINNGIINATSSNDFGVDGTNGPCEFINNGIINTDSYFYCQYGILTNNSIGRIIINMRDPDHTPGLDMLTNGTFNNYGIFINQGYFTIIETSLVNNYGTLTNADIIYNNNGVIINEGKIINMTTIYNYNSGVITNNGIFNNNGVVNNADGTSTCGIGTINGTTSIDGVIGNVCPQH